MPNERTLDSIRVDTPAPPHVPRDRVVDLTWAIGSVPNDLRDPYEPCDWLSAPDIPRLLYNAPKPGSAEGPMRARGHWVVTHHEDIARVYTDNDTFSNKGTAEF